MPCDPANGHTKLIHPAGITGVTYPSTEKSFNGPDLTVAEGVIFDIMDNLVVGGDDIVHGECAVAVCHNLSKFNLLEELKCGTPSFLFIFCKC